MLAFIIPFFILGSLQFGILYHLLMRQRYKIRRAKEQIDHDECLNLYQKQPAMEKISVGELSSGSFSTVDTTVQTLHLDDLLELPRNSRNLTKQKSFAEKELDKERAAQIKLVMKSQSLLV